MAVVKGVPAAALAYHNPGGALVDGAKIASSEEGTLDFGQGAAADGGASDGRAAASGNTARVEGNGGGGGGGGDGGGDGGGGGSIGAVSSRFRCHLI